MKEKRKLSIKEMNVDSFCTRAHAATQLRKGLASMDEKSFKEK